MTILLYLGQLGDGNIYYSVGDELILLKTKEDDFTNLTTGINSIRSFEDWSLLQYALVINLLRYVL